MCVIVEEGDGKEGVAEVGEVFRWCKVSRLFRQSSSLFSTTGNGTTSAVSADAREPVELFLLDRVDFQSLGLGEHFRTELENRVRTLEDCGLFTGETLWDKQELRDTG